MTFSLDGVQESKSSAVSVDVYTVSFNGCRVVYPVQIIRQSNKFKINEQQTIKRVIDDINQNECRIHTATCDNLKRSILRRAKCHSASFPCEYCECKAVLVKGENQRRGQLAWPTSTMNGELRTIQKIIDITDKIRESDVPLTIDECKGFTGTSHLLHQPNFNFISGLPAEYMHSTCIGTVKRLVELTFNVGENRERITKRKLSEASVYNKLINEIQDPREFSRRGRNMDLGVMKAQEFRNIICFYYPLVISCIPDEFKNEQKIWLHLAFVVRACVISNREFVLIPKQKIKRSCEIFYKMYEKTYGKKNCSYSIHIVGCHILEVRGDEPLTEKSAFKFENFYSELRNLFQAGTTSTTKQMIQNCYMKRLLEPHSCCRHIHFDVAKNGKECNNLVYIFNESNEYDFYNIVEKHDDDTFTCQKQGRSIIKDDVNGIKWETVGVFKVGPFSEEQVRIKKEDISGKVVKVKDFFLTCPNNVLREQ